MDKNQGSTVEDKTVEVTGATAVAEVEPPENGENSNDVKTEAQKLADAIVAKKLSKMPTKEELKAFKEWQESQKTEEQKKEEEAKEKIKLAEENSNLKKEKLILKKGINDDDAVEFILFKLNKLEGDFEDNLNDFLKNNPKYLSSEEDVETTGIPAQRGSLPQDGVMSILKSKHPDLYQ